ncbi:MULTISPECIES: hypothetical protein [Nocardia]|nr:MULTISPECIES: hypothetical protein [Nocardia]
MNCRDTDDLGLVPTDRLAGMDEIKAMRTAPVIGTVEPTGASLF